MSQGRPSEPTSRSLAMSWPYPRHRHFESHLRTAATKWFAARGYKVHSRYPFMLADWNDWHLNIIDPHVVEHVKAERERRAIDNKGFPLHDYLHHGLSSQAMIFNLLGPLIVRNDLDALKDVFVSANLPWPEGETSGDFEHEDRNVFGENAGQPTSIDVVIKDGTGRPKLFIESKLVERDFGGCSVFGDGDCDGKNPSRNPASCYLHHIGRQYWQLMEKWGFLTGPLSTDSTCIFANYYQFFREVLFALESGGSFVLISDERSPSFSCDGSAGRRGLMPFLLSLVPESLRQHIGQISVQQIIAALKASDRHTWVAEFEPKYGLAD